MSIQFGDILQHNNQNYPIVDITDIKGGLRSIATFSDASLLSEFTSGTNGTTIPEKYKTGYSLMLERSTGTIYYLSGISATNSSHWSPIGIAGNGYGVTNTIPKWTSSSILGNSNITDNGDTVTINGNLMVIGTTSTISSENLLVKDPIILLAGSQSGTPTYDAGLFVNRGSSDTQAFIWDESMDEFKFITTTSDATVSGDVSIGTYSNVRTGVLSVGTGTKVNSRFLVSSSGGTVSLIVDEFGNVYNNGNGGIATNTAFGESALSTNTTGNQNTAFGYHALRLNRTSSFNTAIGYNALENNSSDVNTLTLLDGGSGYTTGTYSSVQLVYATGSTAETYPTATIVVGVGGTVISVTLVTNGTGFKDTTTVMSASFSGTGTGFSIKVSSLNNPGANNTAVGNFSLHSNTSGVYNNAFGYLSMRYNTKGSYNAAFGLSSMLYNTTGDRNTGLGNFSLANNTTGTYNTAVGFQSLQGNTTGFYNVALGFQSLYGNTTGSNNIGISNNSLNSNTTGAVNIAVGSSTLFKNVKGSYNIALGASSLYSNTAGDFNIAIGANALRSNTTGVATFSTFNPGSGYVDNYYSNITLQYLSGGTFSTAPIVDIQVNAGTVSSVNLVSPGSGFVDTTTIFTASIGPAGSGFQIGISSLLTNSGVISIGYQSLYSNTTGSDNLAIGAYSLYTNTTGYNNLAIGYQSLNQNTIGNSNVAVGKSSLKYNTGGYSNIAIGTSALLTNMTGFANTAVGDQSLYSNTGGDFNTAIGYNSLHSNIGSENTAIGGNALYYNTTGSVNIALGNYSLWQNTTGQVNTALGKNALQKNTAGNNNIALGYQSLYNNTSGVFLAFSWSGGTGYEDGYYENVTLVYATGSSFTTAPIVEIYITSGEVSFVNTISSGTGFKDTTTIFTINSYGTYSVGSGFEIGVIGLISGSSNLAIGNSSLLENTTGSSNLSIGNSSLYNNTIGNYNTAIGQQSLYYNTTGGSNIALGYSSLQFNTSGDGNVALGYASLNQNTTGEYNVTLGYSSLYNNKIGSYNIALGYRSLYSSTQSNYNLAIGYNSLYYNQSGFYNIALGDSSLYNNTTGIFNTAIGLQALSLNTTGYTNIALGYSSLYSNTTGWGNIALGESSLRFNTTGDRNNALGYSSLRYYRGLWSTALGAHSLNNASQAINTLTATFSPGNSYTPGTYSNVRLSWTSGTFWLAPTGQTNEYPTAEIVVGTGGTVSSVTLKQRGVLIPDNTTRFTAQTGTQSYHLGTASGSGFSIGISTIGTASLNNALGHGALGNLGVGSHNIGIGMWAGIYYGTQSNWLSGSDQSIFIGTFTSALNNDSVNEIAIGHYTVGNGNNTVTLGNDSVIKTYLKGKVQLPTIPTNSGTYSGTYSTYHILTRNDTTGEVEKVRPNVDEIDAGTLTITLTYLTTTYPNATTGFKIYQHRPGFPTLIFEKTASIWIQYQANSTF